MAGVSACNARPSAGYWLGRRSCNRSLTRRPRQAVGALLSLPSAGINRVSWAGRKALALVIVGLSDEPTEYAHDRPYFLRAAVGGGAGAAARRRDCGRRSHHERLACSC